MSQKIVFLDVDGTLIDYDAKCPESAKKAVDLARANGNRVYICTGCSDAIYSGLDAEGLTDGSVKFATVDISSQTGVYYKNGVQVWTCGGQYVTPVVAFAILYNYIHDGVRMIPDATKPLIRKYIEITSYEDYENYCKFIEADIPPYTAEEVSRMMLVFNPDVTLETLQNDADTYGLADVMARHADLIK